MVSCGIGSVDATVSCGISQGTRQQFSRQLYAFGKRVGHTSCRMVYAGEPEFKTGYWKKYVDY